MKQIKKLLKKPLDMQQTQVVVLNQVQVGLRASTAMFPGWMPLPMRTAMSVPADPGAIVMSVTPVKPHAPGPK